MKDSSRKATIRRLRAVLLCITVFTALSGIAAAQTVPVTLAWDANSESDLAGYVLSYGRRPRQYTGSVTVGLVTEHTIQLDANVTFYFVVKALNTRGVTSLPSNEVAVKTIPIPAPFDTDQDGNADILWQHSSTGQLAVWRMKTTTMVAGYLLMPEALAGIGWEVAGTADLNGDGHGDLVWQHDTGAVAYWLLQGNRLLGSALIGSGVPPAWRIAATGDVDGDGSPDLIWQHEDGTVYVWYMDGVRLRSSEHVTRLADPKWRIVGARDLDRDGGTDLVWHHSGDGSVAAWLMKDRTLISGLLVDASVPDLNWRIVGLADFNADGRMDFLWRHTQTGALYAWFMRGTRLVQAAPLSPSAMTDMNWRIVGPR